MCLLVDIKKICTLAGMDMQSNEIVNVLLSLFGLLGSCGASRRIHMPQFILFGELRGPPIPPPEAFYLL